MKKIVLACVLGLLTGAARAATVYLKEGGTIEGTLVSSTGQQVVIETFQGRVSIGLDRVDHIDYGSAAPAPSPAYQEPAAPPPVYYRRRWRRRAIADAEPYEPRVQELSMDVGVDAPLNSVSLSGTTGGGSANDGDAGVLVGLQYLYRTSPRAAWGLEFHYYDRSPTDSPNLLPGAESHVYGNSLLLMGVMKYSLVDRGYVRPFLLLGVGAHRTQTVVDAHPFPGYGWPDTDTGETRTLVDDSAVGLAGSARLGLDFGFVGPNVFSLEAGWTGLESATYSATGQGQALGISGVRGPINYFTFAGRWGFDF